MPVTLSQRDVIDEVKTTLSSWDNCMSKNYCKWPAIVGIVVASIVLISVVWCIVQCACCGASCCCGCFSCFKSCCPTGRNKRHKPLPSSDAYVGSQYRAPQPISYGPPQYAQFDASNAKTGKPFNEDALPVMPSWDTAASRKVEESPMIAQSPQDLEMKRLNHDRSDYPMSQSAPMLPNVDENQGQFVHHGSAPNGDVGSANEYYTGQQSGVVNSPGYGGRYTPGPYDDNSFTGYATPAYAQSRYAPTRMGSTAGQTYSSRYDAPVSPVSNPYGTPVHQQPRHAPVGRRPVQGSWRDI